MDSLKRMAEDCRTYAAEYRASSDKAEADLAEIWFVQVANEWDVMASHIEALMSRVEGRKRADRTESLIPLYAAPQDCDEVRRELDKACRMLISGAKSLEISAEAGQECLRQNATLRAQLEAAQAGAAAMREALELGREIGDQCSRGYLRRFYAAADKALSSDAGRDYVPAEMLHALESEAAAMREHIERYGVVSSDDEIAEMQKSRARVLSGEAGKGLVERLRKAEEDAKKWREMDTCMCGSPMDAHSIADGHSPVSMYEYNVSSVEDERDQLRAELDREHLHKKHLRGALGTCTAELERYQWRTVSDELPPPRTEVQVYCAASESVGLAYLTEYGWEIPEQQVIGYESITHWALLNAAPEGEGNS